MYVWEIEDIDRCINRQIIISNINEDEENIAGIEIFDDSQDSKVTKNLLELEDKREASIFRKEHELFKKSVSINKAEVEQMMNDISIYFTENVQKSLDDIEGQLLEISNKVLPCEKGIEIFSRIYLKLIESVFSIIMATNCFLIETIKKGHSKKIIEYFNMGIASMENIISSQTSNECLLFGYNRIIRNSIAHSKMDTRKFGKKIVFIDEYRGRKRTVILEHKEFRELIYILYRNILVQITANRRFWETTIINDSINSLPILDIQTYLACIRDELYNQINRIRDVIMQDGYNTLPEFDVFNIEYDNSSSLIISIRINSYCEELLHILLKEITYCIAGICRFLENGIDFKLTDIKSNILDIEDNLIMIGGCKLS